MGSPANKRASEICTRNIRGMVHRWLATLPPSGWTGTVHDLEAALRPVNDAAPCHERAPVPTGRGITAALERNIDLIDAAGFALTFHRTATVRTLIIRPVRRRPAPTAVPTPEA